MKPIIRISRIKSSKLVTKDNPDGSKSIVDVETELACGHTTSGHNPIFDYKPGTSLPCTTCKRLAEARYEALSDTAAFADAAADDENGKDKRDALRMLAKELRKQMQAV